MSLVSVSDLTIGFRGPPLLDNAQCRIEPGQHIGLLGRNGAGKTTFMRLLSGEIEPDHGEILLQPGAHVRQLPQGVPTDIQGTIEEVVLRGCAGCGWESWEAETETRKILERMELNSTDRFETLSSGMKRRVLLAQALVSRPDLLLLDEPTNHLDLKAIEWLENFLKGWRGTLLFVTHDRMFLQNLADRILEIDRGQLFDWTCDYPTFLQRKAAAIEAEEKQQALFDKKLAEEEVWIRKGIQARRTRNEGRVRALKAMREQRRDRRDAPGTIKLQIQEGQRSGSLIARLEHIGFGYADAAPLINDFSCHIMRGDKVGIIGPNGVGKTTLLKILLGQLQPTSGHVRLGTHLQIAYFDQLREQLDEAQTVEQNVGDGYDTIQVGDSKQHIIGYLKEFLFTPERARTPVKFLSGGERNRILLAKLFAKPANVIVLDEPTNDLDTETLELLEERLSDYRGTVLVVSHDRQFLNQVVTSCIVFENQTVKEYVGGYDDWIRQRSSPPPSSPDASTQAKTSARSGNSQPVAVSQRPAKLSFKEKRELEALPGEIEALELEIEELHKRMADPSFYQSAGAEISQATARLQELDQQLELRMERWEELESRAS